MFEKIQSGLRKNYNTETALLKVINYLVLSVDVGHNILLDLLETWVGISGTTLLWFRSYVKDWCFCIGIADSRSTGVHCMVPQDSVLGPILFSIYMLLLGHIIHINNNKPNIKQSWFIVPFSKSVLEKSWCHIKSQPQLRQTC